MIAFWWMVGLAAANDLESMTAEERALRLCTHEATPFEAARTWSVAAAVWERCATDFSAANYTTELGAVRDQGRLLRLLSAAEPERQKNPGAWAERVLGRVAAQGTSRYPTGTLVEVFRSWATSEAGKTRLSGMRTVSVAWTPGAPDDPAWRARHAELFRRYVQDLGLRWGDPGSPDVEVLVRLNVSSRDLPPRTTARLGSLALAESSVRVASVRFVRLDRTEPGFEGRLTVESVRAADASEEALRGAMERAAAQLLKTVLRVAFPERSPSPEE